MTTPPLSSSRLSEIRALREAISPTPWIVDARHGAIVYCSDDIGAQVANCQVGGDLTPLEQQRNTEFIAQAPTIIDQLLAENEQLRAQAERWKNLYEFGSENPILTGLAMEITAEEALAMAFKKYGPGATVSMTQVADANVSPSERDQARLELAVTMRVGRCTSGV